MILQGVVDLILPFIAAGAHVGGLIGGFAVMPFAARGALVKERPSTEQRAVAAAVAILLLASLASAGLLLQRDPSAMASHGRHLLSMQSVGARALNDLAWMMATESEPEGEELVVAVQLAEPSAHAARHLEVASNPSVAESDP